MYNHSSSGSNQNTLLYVGGGVRILVSSDLGFPYLGGAETAVINITKRLAKDHEVTWFMSRINNTKQKERLKGINIRRIYVPFRKNYFLTRKTYPITSFLPLLKQAKKSDVIQFCSFIGALNGQSIGKLSKRPYFCHVWELFGSLWKRFTRNWLLYQAIERYIANSYPFYVAISNYTKRRLMSYGTPEEKIMVNHLAVDHKQFYPAEPKFKIKNKFNIGWCGRMKLSLSKNLPLLLESFKLLREETDAVLLLAGTGFNTLKPQIKELGLEKDIIYLGRLPNGEMKNFYSSLDIYALPSYSEGFGLVALEAQACGTPVACFNVGALPEIVKGDLIEEMTPEAFAEGMLTKFIKKQTLINHAKKFTWEKTAQRQLKVYERLLE